MTLKEEMSAARERGGAGTVTRKDLISGRSVVTEGVRATN
jgi:hypothetical protein